MTRLFEERERAAETIFVQAEERLFLGRRRGLQALAAWASRAMGHDDEAATIYEQDLIVAMIKGASDDTLVARVCADVQADGRRVSHGAAIAVFAQGAASTPIL
ncbi:ATPase inhibitor subunit zeta [Beijerinckia sp. L45]|uniref:ATPase inhibitor subunit zeta n=1 Tax=Beijerinckia sp. L45 TaxID=1641855 RepID=UPI00131D93FA|nr:ATPase inhibitor subunit zeta [Beijerinckia sp. L45]